MSDDVALDVVDERHVPHVQELAQVVQDAAASVGHAGYASFDDVPCWWGGKMTFKSLNATLGYLQ